MVGGIGNNASDLVICKLPIDEVVLATDLCDCDDDFPDESVDWDLSNYSDGLVKYHMLLGWIGILVVVLNCMVILGVLREEKLHRLHYWQIVGQAISDLLVGMLVVSFNFVTWIRNGNFVGGDIGCKIYAFGIVGTCHSTVFSLATIAWVREVRVLHNCKIKGKKVFKAYMALVWGLSSLLTGYYVLVSRGRMVCSGGFCNPIWNVPTILVCGIFLWIPICYIIRVYSRIIKVINKTIGAVEDQLGDVGRARKQQEEATRLMMYMCGAILFSWLPLFFHFLISIYRVLSDAPVTSGMLLLERFVGIGAAGSSAISPIIYGIMNKSLYSAMRYAFFPKSWEHRYRERQKAKQRLMQSSGDPPPRNAPTPPSSFHYCTSEDGADLREIWKHRVLGVWTRITELVSPNLVASEGKRKEASLGNGTNNALQTNKVVP